MLKKTEGEAMNAILSVGGMNFRKLLGRTELLLRHLLYRYYPNKGCLPLDTGFESFFSGVTESNIRWVLC